MHASTRRQAWPEGVGVALMLYPYAIGATWLLYAVGIALCVGVCSIAALPEVRVGRR
jgi:hypothetical protein